MKKDSEVHEEAATYDIGNSLTPAHLLLASAEYLSVTTQQGASMIKRFSLLIFILLTITGCAISPPEETGIESVSFLNCSTNKIRVNRVLRDGEEFRVPCGVLGPGFSASTSFIPLPAIPEKFTIEFEKDGQSLSHDIDTTGAAAALEQAPPAKKITLHFIYSDRETFILKLEFDRAQDAYFFEGDLWPDMQDPTLASYRTLVRASYLGNAEEVRQHLRDGIPFFWKNDPVALSPLEYATINNRIAVFDELMAVIPKSYSGYAYANCVKLAAQNDKTEILTKLLAHPSAETIPRDRLGRILCAAVYHAENTATLSLLLKHFEVDIDFFVTDVGHTMLFIAVLDDNTETAKWLISQGANPNPRLNIGGRALEHARSDEMKQLLLQAQP